MSEQRYSICCSILSVNLFFLKKKFELEIREGVCQAEIRKSKTEIEIQVKLARAEKARAKQIAELKKKKVTDFLVAKNVHNFDGSVSAY